MTYRPFFKKFTLLERGETAGETPALYRCEQAADPWVFGVTVQLGLADTSIEKLPAEIREKIGGIDSGKLFSVSQLFLNTTSFIVIELPQVFAQGTQQRRQSLDLFLGSFFAESRRAAGNFALGYTLPPDPSPSGKQYLVNPVDYRYYVSPYLDAQGKPSAENKDLYTLNYIAICSQGAFPALRPLHWNWVEAHQKGETQGALAIERRRVLAFAKGQFGEMIAGLLLKPQTFVGMTRRTAHLSIGFDGSGGQSSMMERDEALIYTYQSQPAHDRGVMADIYADTQFQLTEQIRLYTTADNRAVVEFDIEMACGFRTKCTFFERGDQCGDGLIYHKGIRCALELNIGSDGQDFGRLLITPTVQREDLNTYLHIDGLKDVHCIKDSITQAQAALCSRIDGIVGQFEAEFIKRFNGQACSRFIPGSESAAYGDTGFSNSGDLVFRLRLTKEV